MLGPCALEISSGAAGRSVCHRARLAHAGRVSKLHTSRSGLAPLRLALDDEGLATEGDLVARRRIGDLARPHLERTVPAWMRVSPKLTMASGQPAWTRAVTGSPPAGV